MPTEPEQSLRLPESGLNGDSLDIPLPDESESDTGPLDRMPSLNSDASSLIDAEQAVRLRAVPFGFDDGRLLVAMMDTADADAIDEIALTAALPVQPRAIEPDAFDQLIRSAFGTTAAKMAARLGGESDEDDLVANLQAIEADDLHRMAEQPSLINLVNLIILEGIRARASDIHIEPFEKQLTVKYRVDGVLVEQDSPPKTLQPAITSRIKIMAGMNIAERYAPQDGHITLRFEGRKIDIRVSTVPTIYGESIVMRILDKESISLDLETLGMEAHDRNRIHRMIDLPHGMVLVTGPTGSGKTTTLYACLTRLYDPGKKIITIEDPVEYELSGINQIPVNPKRGLTFATGLRSILRQDPDVVMVGEIRDGETAEIAVRAALTGHLIFSTLHTNNAPSAIGRLLDMGIEPFLLSSVLEGVLAQRLGRKICQECRDRARISEATWHRLSSRERAMFDDGMAWKGSGCDECNGSGYRGRIGFFELMAVHSDLRAAIANKAGPMELRTKAGRDFVTMREDGLAKALAGRTSIEQVLRSTQDTEELPTDLSSGTRTSDGAGN
ncbi:MAG: type II/IV secretion system protein [Phycisphaeraceae bacterium]|nr:type II/IV secretion system protein [Phycisphaerales bacterium]MCB9861416.1 type II/IV secretion system protein [Phycisphaeraceae bacterium]